jgi:hypothetical protein
MQVGSAGEYRLFVSREVSLSFTSNAGSANMKRQKN